MYNKSEGSISCIAVDDMLKKRLGEYTDALANGADEATIASMEDEIDKIEAVHEKCIANGDVTEIGTSRIVIDESEGEGGEGDVEDVSADDVSDDYDVY